MWTLQLKQDIIASELYIDKSEKGTQLLVKWSLNSTQLKKKALVEEPRLRQTPQKNSTKLCIEIRKEPPRKLWNKTTIRSDNNIKEQEVAILLTGTNNKIHELKIYNKAIDDPVHSRHSRETISKELQNLESHQT